jgi:predicted nucleotidyltransferase
LKRRTNRYPVKKVIEVVERALGKKLEDESIYLTGSANLKGEFIEVEEGHDIDLTILSRKVKDVSSTQYMEIHDEIDKNIQIFSIMSLSPEFYKRKNVYNGFINVYAVAYSIKNEKLIFGKPIEINVKPIVKEEDVINFIIKCERFRWKNPKLLKMYEGLKKLEFENNHTKEMFEKFGSYFASLFSK